MQHIEGRKRRRRTLECLPNEVLLDLFEYFDGVRLLHAFYGLNYRFNYLLYNQSQFYTLNFHSMSKKQTFDTICQQHLPYIANRVVKIHLTEVGRIPQQINYFFSYISSLTQFTHLRSLSIRPVHSTDVLLKIFDECQHVVHLTHLYIYFFPIPILRTDFELYLDKMWSLPKLTYLALSIHVLRQKLFLPTKRSVTLKSIDFYATRLSWSELDQLFQYTPHLQHLSIHVKSTDNHDLIPTPPSTLVKLTIFFSFSCDMSKILLFLQKLSNLRYLKMTLISNLINGNQWEQLIRHYLLKLKTFHLNMSYSLQNNLNIKDQADQLIDTFRSSFWIEEHRWFVRYHLIKNELHLFTLSNALYYHNNNFPDFWQSTDPHDNQQTFYSRMRGNHDENFFNQSFTFDVHLSNIIRLSIKFPINKQFWSIITSFKKLYSLTIYSYDDQYQSQLQTIIDQAPKLRSLTIYQNELLPLPMSLFKLTNLFIDNLTLEQHQFNEEECTALSQSHLVKNCESLSIHVKNYQNILILVENMINLQSLYVQYGNEIECEMNNDEVIQWLKNHLPSTCLITKHSKTDNILQIWM